MVISTHDGQIYEDEVDYHFDRPMNQEGRQPLRITVHPDDRPGESETGSPEGGIQQDHKLFFVRHGETPENETNVVRESDTHLTDKGRKQAETAARQLKSEGVNAIVASDLPRSKESAHIIAAKLGIVPQFDSRLQTWNVGKFEGQPCEEANPQINTYAKDKPDEKVPGGESFNEFKDRSFDGIRDAINNNQGKKLAVLTHSKVEAAINGWNATGQDNPSLDMEVATKEQGSPGSVEHFTMKANSTIMSEGNQQVAENFDERFGKWGVINPGTRNEVYAPSEMYQKIPESDLHRPFQGISPSRGLGTEPTHNKQISPPGKPVKTSMYPGKGPTIQEDTPLAQWAKRMGEKGWEDIKGMADPNQMIPGAGGNLGMARAYPRSIAWLKSRIETAKTNLEVPTRIKELLDEGMNATQIGEEIGLKPSTVRSHISRYKLRGPKESTVEPDWLKEELSKDDPLEGLSQKELSDWYKNQFEGAPVEPTKPTYHVYDTRTGKAVTKQGYSNRNAARSLAEKKNLEWGAHRYYAMAEHLHDEPFEPISEGGPIEPEDLKNQYPEVYKKMMEEFEKTKTSDFNTANRGVTQLHRPANENVKDE